MSTHPQVVTVAAGAPLEIVQAPTINPKANEVRVRVEWTASTPLDMHQAVGGLLVKHPQGLGDGVAGTVVEIGPSARYKVGDKVFGFTWRNNTEKAHQLYATAPDNLLGKLPDGWTLQQAVTLPNNFVTAWHLLTAEFSFELPWPKPDNYAPLEKDDWIFVWGGSGSVGQFVIQILKWYGYTNILTTASKQHHDKLKKYGAMQCFDYRDSNVTAAVAQYVSQKTGGHGFVKYLVDCIGSQPNSIKPLAEIAQEGSVATILLPVIVRDVSETEAPIYEMDVTKGVDWKQGVKATGVRTHFYGDNKFLWEKLQPEIMPMALELGIVEANDQVIVEGKTLLERAEKAMHILKTRGVSGARLVWRVAEEGED